MKQHGRPSERQGKNTGASGHSGKRQAQPDVGTEDVAGQSIQSGPTERAKSRRLSGRTHEDELSGDDTTSNPRERATGRYG